MTLKTSDGFGVGDVVPESAAGAINYGDLASDFTGVTYKAVNAAPCAALRPARWRLAVVGGVRGLDTPALYLNRIEGVQAWRPIEKRAVTTGRRSRKSSIIPAPIFGPYLFLKIPDDAIPAALNLRCNDQPILSRIIAGGCGVSVIPDAEIDALRSEISAGAFAPKPKPAHRFKTGDAARVRGGAFDGFDTVVESIMGDKARVIVNLFGRETPAQMPISSLGVAG